MFIGGSHENLRKNVSNFEDSGIHGCPKLEGQFRGRGASGRSLFDSSTVAIDRRLEPGYPRLPPRFGEKPFPLNATGWRNDTQHDTCQQAAD